MYAFAPAAGVEVVKGIVRTRGFGARKMAHLRVNRGLRPRILPTFSLHVRPL